MKITIEGEPKEIAIYESALKDCKKQKSYSIKMDGSSASTDMKRLIEKYPENFTGDILHSLRVQIPKQKAAEHESVTREIKDLEKLATPLVQWVRENYGYHTEVHISADLVCIKHDGMAIPYPISEK